MTVDKLLKQLESSDINVVYETINELREVVLNLDDKDSIQRILEAIVKNRPNWGGPSMVGDCATFLTDSCKERKTNLTTVEEALEQLDSNRSELQDLAFGRIMTIAKETEDPADLQKIIKKFETERFSISSFHRHLTEENIESTKEFCKAKIRELKKFRFKPLHGISRRSDEDIRSIYLRRLARK